MDHTDTASIALAPAPAQDDRLAVKPRKAAEMLGLGVTRVYELINSGELASYRDGGARLILTASIRERIARRVRASAPPNKRMSRQPDGAS